MTDTKEQTAPATPDVIEINNSAEDASLIGQGDSAMEIEHPAPTLQSLSTKYRRVFAFTYHLERRSSSALEKLYFLLNVAKVPAYETGHIFLIGQFWSALANPVIGHLSDRTRSRWGRRRPWILFSALPLAICQVCLWQTPDLGDGSGKFLYYCLMYLALNTTLACTSVPYTSMTPEIAPRYDDSTAITSLRFFFGLLSGLVSLLAWDFIVAAFDTKQDGYAIAAVIFAVVGASPSILLFFTIPEKSSLLKMPEPPKSWRKTGSDLLALVQNRAFVTVCFIYLLCWVTTNAIQSNLVIYLKYVLHVEQHWMGILVCLQLSVAAAILGWQRMCDRFGKKATFCVGVIYWAMVHLCLFYIPAHNPLAIYILSSLAGVGVGLAFLLPWSMLPDVIEEDELRVGERREGFLYSVFVVLQQVGIAGALAASSYALGRCGYIPGDPEEQPKAVQLMLRLLVGPVSSCVLLLALVMGMLYPITRERRAKVSALLAERHARLGLSPHVHTSQID